MGQYSLHISEGLKVSLYLPVGKEFHHIHPGTTLFMVIQDGTRMVLTIFDLSLRVTEFLDVIRRIINITHPSLSMRGETRAEIVSSDLRIIYCITHF